VVAKSEESVVITTLILFNVMMPLKGEQIECGFALSNSDHVGRLIGTKGETIKSICHETGTYINFSQGNQGTVCGKKQSVSNAFERMAIVLAEVDDSISLDIIIPQTQVGKIVGKKGVTVKKLEQDSGGKISIQKPFAEQQNVSITGTPAAVTHALNYIISVVTFPNLRKSGKRSFSQMGGALGHRPAKRVFGIRGIHECPVSLLDSDSVSKIIGTAGGTIKRICEESATRISFRGLIGVITGKKREYFEGY